MSTQLKLVSQSGDLESSAAVEALVLTCIDFRLTGAICNYLESRGLAGNYDHLSIAGAALGVTASDDPAWAKTFWDHLAMAREMHNIQRVIVIDHRDCGACKKFIGPDCADDPDAELVAHMRAMEKLADEINTHQPGLEVELLLMSLDGHVDELET